MEVINWVSRYLVGRRIRKSPGRWDRETLAPRLRVKRLEERRVLNAQAMPVEQLVIDAGAAGGDGQADTFHVEQDAEHIRVSVNGQEVSRTPLGQIESITIRGSLDDDILVAEFKSGEPLAGLELLFEGGAGGADSLILAEGAATESASFNEVAHHFGESGQNRVELVSGAGSSTIEYVGVEAVSDQLSAQNRTFIVESGARRITLDDNGVADDDLSRIVVSDSADPGSVLAVTFKNPSERLGIESIAGAGESNTVALNGLDQKFDGDLRVLGSENDVVSVGGPIDVGRGEIDLLVGTVRIEDSLTTAGGSVHVHAEHEAVIGSGGVVRSDSGDVSIQANSIEHSGSIYAASGRVTLDSGVQGTTIVRGVVDVSAADAIRSAGTVHILGFHVGLLDDAQITASAAIGGGVILIGGDYQGKNPAIHNAARTYIGSNTVIRADATLLGTGGKVVVWADEITRFYGNITARGGSQGGDGGFAEVSGRQVLDFSGFADLSAANGNKGTLLLDPDELNITAADATDNGELNAPGDPIFEFTDGPATSNITATHLVGQLDKADIVLQANIQIDVEVAVDASANNKNDPGDNSFSLELDAPTINFDNGADIILNHADLTIGNTKAGNVVLLDGAIVTLSTAGGAGTGTGNLALNGTVSGTAGGASESLTLNSGPGTLNVVGAVSTLDTLTIAGSDAATFTGAITVTTLSVPAAVNNASFTGTGTVITNAVAFANSGDLVLGQAGGMQTYDGGVDTTGVGGTVTLNGTIATSDDAITLGPVTLGSNATLDTNASTAAGDITLGAVTGATFNLTLETGAVAGADVTGTSVANVGALAFQNIGGAVSFTGPITATSLSVPNTINDVSLTGKGTVITNAVDFNNTGDLVLGQAGGTQVYTGGLDFTDVGGTVTLNGIIVDGSEVTIDGEADADVIEIRRNGADVEVRLDTVLVFNSPIAGLTLITINGQAGDDLLTVDHSFGFVDIDVVYKGGALGNDKLAVEGDATDDTANYTPDLATKGNGVVAVTDGGANSMSITFSDLEPVDITGMLTATLTLPNADDVLTLTNGKDAATNLIPAIVVTGTSGGVAIEAAHFFGNTTVVIDTTAKDGKDTITVASADNAHGNTNLTFTTGANGDTIVFNGAVNVTGAMTITSVDADVNDNSDAAIDITAAKLTVTAATFGDAGVNNAIDTKVDTISIDTSGSSGDQYINEADGVSIALLKAGGGDIRLVANGDITQTGAITANEFGVRQNSAAAGNVTLTGNNDVDELAGSNAFAGGTFSFRDTDGLSVESVTASGPFAATDGITTNGGDVLLDIEGALSIDKAINVGAADVRLVVDGNITQAAPGTITANELGIRQQNAASGNVTLTAENDVDELAVDNDAAGGSVSFRNVDGLIIETVTAAGAFALTSGITTNGGDVLLDMGDVGLNTGGPLTINQAINAGAGDVRIVARGNVTQALAATIIADQLGIRQQSAVLANVVLTEANNVAELAVDNAAAAGIISFRDINDLTIGAVTAAGAFTATSGITTNLGAVTLVVGDSLLIAQEIDATGALVTVTAVDSILDASGPTNDISALAVSLTAANAIGTITNFAVADLGADSNGAGDAIEITVSTLSLVQTTAANSTIHLVQTGTLAITAGAVDVAGLNSGQAIIQTTGNLNAGAVLPIDLTGNDSLALLSSAALTIPLAGFNAGTGDLRMVGALDVLATGGGNLIFAADDLFFQSGGVGGDEVLNTTVASVTALLATNDLTINETNGVNVLNVDVTAGSADISTITGNLNITTVSASATATLSAIAGSLTDANAGANNITAVSLVASAVTGIDLDTSVANITATNSGAGNIDIDESDGAAVLNVAASAGNADVSTTTGSLNVFTVSASGTATLAAGAGLLTDGNGNGPNNVTAVSLVASSDSGIELDTTVTNITATTSGVGNIDIDESNGANVLNVAASSGNADVSTLANDLTVTTISASGTATLTALAGLIADGSGANNVTAGSLVASAATGIDLNTTVGNMTATNSGAGNVDIDESDGANVLNVVASAGNADISTAAGSLNVSTISASVAAILTAAAGSITDGNDAVVNDGTLNIVAADLLLNASVGIGAGDALDTAVVRLEAASGAGGLFVINQNTLDIGGISAQVGATAAGDVVLQSLAGDINVLEVVSSTGQSVSLTADNDLNMGADLTAANGDLILSAGRDNIAALNFTANITLTASGGMVSSVTFAFAGNRYTVLDNSVDQTVAPLTQAQNVAQIQAIINDLLPGTNYQLTIDWKEGNNISPRFDPVVPTLFNGNVPVVFMHTYLSNPQPNPSDDIPITVNITQLAGGTLQASFGGRDVVGPLDANGSFGDGVVGISFIIVIDVLTPFTFVPILPPASELPRTIVAPTPLVSQVEVVAQPVERGATLPVESSAAFTSEGEERYYELRIVFYDMSGNLRESPLGERINLNDAQLRAIAPFDLSKLPELFGRLPADRYRIYLIEDGTERLVLDFIIQQGRPLEMPEREEGAASAAQSVDGVPSGLQNGDVEPLNGVLEFPADGATPPIENGTFRGDSRLRGLRFDLEPSERTVTESFAERLGRSPFFAHGGVVAGAATLACAASTRREKSVDKLMERFDQRRQSTRRARNAHRDSTDHRVSSDTDAHHIVSNGS